MFRLLCLLGFHIKRPEAFFTCNPNDRDIICVRCYTKKEKWGKEDVGASFLTTPIPEQIPEEKPAERTIGGLNLEEWEYVAKVIWKWPGIDPSMTSYSQICLEHVNKNIHILKQENADGNKSESQI